MNFLKRIRTEEIGQLLILAVIFLMLGSLTLVPLLNFTFTELDTSLMYTSNMYELYACDAGIEDATQKLLKQAPPLDTLEVGDSYSYTIDSVNGKSVSVMITGLSLLTGLLGEDEYKTGQPHEGWLQFELPTGNITRNYEEDWVEYTCELNFHYDGDGSRKVESVGAYFAPYPSDIIEGPYDEMAVPIMTFDNLKSQELKIAAGGFAFIYRWLFNLGPEFDKDNRDGSLILKFKVYDADWTAMTTFAWATFKEEDISYVTTADLSKWLIEASAGKTMIKAQALYDSGAIDLLCWEVKPSD